MRTHLFGRRHILARSTIVEGITVGRREQRVGSLIALRQCRPALLRRLLGSQRGQDAGLAAKQRFKPRP